MYRILIVEDDRGIAGAVQTQLEAWGLEARCVSDFRNVLGEYRFFIEIDGDIARKEVVSALKEAEAFCRQFHIIGAY